MIIDLLGKLQRLAAAPARAVRAHCERKSLRDLSATWCYQLRDAETGELDFDSGWRKNVICDTCGKVLAALVKEETSYGGAQYLAVGIGNASWDTNGTPSPSALTTQLVSELARKAVSIAFLDDSNNPTASVTNRLEIEATFGSGEANGAHRELGIFGGNATASTDSGLMVNYLTQGIQTKASGQELTIRVRFVFV